MLKSLLPLLFLLDVAATLYLWGVIWTVQLVHYPLFARVGPEQWAAYHAGHTRLMTAVVLPAMVTELGTSGLLALSRPVWLSPPLLWAGFACAVLTWAVTFSSLSRSTTRFRAASTPRRLIGLSPPTGSAPSFGPATRFCFWRSSGDFCRNPDDKNPLA